MIWLIVFTAMFSIQLSLLGLAFMALPVSVRHILVWLADMTPGQLRFVGVFVCLAAMAVMLAVMLLITFADF